MLTDDPGTPGNGHIEINFAATLERQTHRQLWQLQVVDINFGVGERIQLNLSTSVNLDQDDVSGAGSTSAALKWRFWQSDRIGISASIYPRVEWNISSASVRHGLVDKGTRFFLPVEVAKQFGRFDVGLEIGTRLKTVEADEWVYGIVGGFSSGPHTTWLIELHGQKATDESVGRMTVNLGLKQRLAPAAYLISSFGHDVRPDRDAQPAFIAYLGFQKIL